MDGSIGKGLLGQIAGSMGQMSGDQMKQAENIWKMLDNLSESNPEGYKDFVKNNLQNGFTEMKKEKEEKIKELKVTPEPIFLLKMQANLQTFQLQKEQHPLYQQLRMKDNKNEIKLQDLKKKLDKEVKIYVNVMTHSRVRYPLNEQGKEITNLKEMEQWKVIPYSLQDPQEGKSTSLGTKVYFYEFLINDEVAKMMSHQPQLTEQLVQFIVEKMNNCLKEHRNPLLKQYNYLEENQIIHYQISKLSVVKHKTKKFKFADKKIRNVQPILIEPEADRQFDLQKVKEEIQQKRNAFLNNIDPNQINPNEQEKQQQQNVIKDISDIKLRQQDEEKVKEIVQEQVLDGLRIVSKEEKEKNEKNQQKKKVMIQEMDIPTETTTTTTTKPTTTKATTKVQSAPAPVVKTAQQLIEEQMEKPQYNMKEQSGTIYIEIQLLKVNSIDDMILDVSDKIVKLEVPLIYKLDIPLLCKVNPDTVTPKWSKKTKVLKLTLVKA